MRVRRRSATGPADKTQPEIIRAVKLLGLKHKVLSRAGDGIEDLLVLIPSYSKAYWIFVECKTVERESTGYVRYTKAQKEWRAETPDGPRMTATSFEDALRKLRTLMGLTHPTADLP